MRSLNATRKNAHLKAQVAKLQGKLQKQIGGVGGGDGGSSSAPLSINKGMRAHLTRVCDAKQKIAARTREVNHWQKKVLAVQVQNPLSFTWPVDSILLASSL